MDPGKNKLHSYCALFAVAMALCTTSLLAKAPAEANSKFFYKNLTQSDNFSEVNPRFLEQGKYVVFLVFTGDPDSPEPWDYMLTKADREGHTIHYASTKGVLDYNVLSDDSGVVVLRAVEPISRASREVPYEKIEDWELWYINFEQDEEVLLESSMGLPLADGYQILGLIDLPDTHSGEIITQSKDEAYKLRVRRENVDEKWFFTYYLLDEISETAILETESWVSYTDDEWWPALTWIDNHSFVTIVFESFDSQEFPQSKGIFSIVKVDLLNETSEALHTDLAIRAFPRFSLNPSHSKLYFQKAREGMTELWSLDLQKGDVEQVYAVDGQLGEARFSADESSLVFTQLADNNFDIIRLDFDRGKIEQ